MSDLGALKYRAFISYSHADTSWARWLHRSLEAFHIDKDLVDRETATGTIPSALRPIFRDRDEFTAGKALTEQTLAALDAAQALIVVCSPAAAKSRYVGEEIRLFKSRHPQRPVIPLIVAGRPGDPKSECFPSALEFKLDADGQITPEPDELLAADAQEEGDGKSLALAKVVAGLIGVSSDEIFRRADRERRAALRRRRRVQGAFAALLLLLAVGGLLWREGPYLWEQYHWFTTMGPSVLGPDDERALKPGGKFTECTGGCPPMIVVPAGKFVMGSAEGVGLDTEHPQHEVVITRPFAVGEREVTLAEWDACVAAGVCPATSDTGWGRGARPAINVSWDDAQQYVAWLSRHTGKLYRLPSEAEWEYVTRAGTTTLYSFGDDPAALDDHAWHKGNSGSTTHPVAEKQPNGFGLFDVHGNVWEWVEDIGHGTYDGAPSDGSAWGGQSNDRMLRGGDFFFDSSHLRSAQRYMLPSNFRNYSIGFRVARDLDLEQPR